MIYVLGNESNIIFITHIDRHTHIKCYVIRTHQEPCSHVTMIKDTWHILLGFSQIIGF